VAQITSLAFYGELLALRIFLRFAVLGDLRIGLALISFTVFFCAMHSARHILRTINYSGSSSLRLILGAISLPMLGVLLASATAWHFLDGMPINGAIIQLVFVGLAAVTVPHMALVERVRLRAGW
jgi:hypothetical protein